MLRMSPALRSIRPVAVAACLLLGVILAGALSTRGNAASPPISSDAAVATVTRELGGNLDGVRLYVQPRLIVTGETVATWRRDVFRASADGWLVFVDRHPGANWEHPCWYFYVTAAGGQVQRFDASTPPLALTELTEVTHGRDNPPPGLSEEMLARYSERLRRLPKPSDTRGQAYAFIISGGANQGNNHIRYWNDSAFIYRTLVEYYQYADDHIRVCISDGTNPAVDRSDGTNSPADLDGDGDADIEYPATTTYIAQVFAQLAATLTPSDQLFLFTTDHGGQESGQDCYLNLWNLEELRDDQLAAYIATLPCQTVICTFEQCYSGGMIDDLQGDGRVIATAAHWSELSWAMAPDYLYDTFVYHWTSAVAGETPAGVPVDADTNDDGLVSMSEAFLYAQAHDADNETPQYSSTPSTLGDVLSLRGNLEGVYLAVDGVAIDDDAGGASQGDGDGVIEFGETVELTVGLHNLGQSGASNVVGTLVSSSPYVTLVQAIGEFGTIASEGTATNLLPYVLTVADDVPDGASLGLTLNVSEEPGTVTLSLTARAPGYVVTVQEIDDRDGDGDGMADPGESVELMLDFANSGGCPTPDVTATLQSSGDFVCSDTPIPVGVLTVGGHRLVSGFLVQIAPSCPPITTGVLAVALAGPNGYGATTETRLSVGPWFDDVEGDFAWSLGVTGDDATTGQWVRAEPIGTVYNAQQVQPEYDHTPDPASLCFVTGNGIVGGAAGDADVDGGKTTLLSPAFNLLGASSAAISYWRWYTNSLGNNPNQDYWTVEVTGDGTNWVQLEHTLTSANSWTQYSFDLAGVVPFTSSVRFRFVAQDLAPGSLVEAAVDDIMVTIVRPPMGSGVAGGAGAPVAGLELCRPNPLRSASSLRYRIGASGPVRLELYDVAGRRVATLVDGVVDAGEHAVEFRAVDEGGQRLASGVYFLRFEAPEITQVRSVTILR